MIATTKDAEYSKYVKSLAFFYDLQNLKISTYFSQICDDAIYVYFAIEMFIKAIGMGVLGKGCYLSETWNRLDCFIVLAGEV